MKSSKILLVNISLAEQSTTSFFVMPPAILVLAAYLRENGMSVDVLDLNVLKREHNDCNNKTLISLFEKYLIETNPSLVGCSVMVAGQLELAREILKSTKKLLPHVVTIIGGAHVSQFSREILNNCLEIDFATLGEGETQLLSCANFANNKVMPLSWPDGVVYRKNGEVIITPKKAYIENINKLPVPAYDILDFKDYLHNTSTWHNPYNINLGVRVPIITSRGCPNLCNFCSVSKSMGKHYRPLSANKVVDIIQMLHEKYNVIYFAIFDANFAQDIRRVIDICNEISKRKLKIYIDLPTGMPINVGAKEMIEALADVGLIRTCISIESGDTYIRNNIMRKNVKEDEIHEIVTVIRRFPQIFLLTDFVLGMPEDTIESLNASCELISCIDVDDIELSIATPYPGTSLYEQCKKKNLFFKGIDLSSFWMTSAYTHANINNFFIKPYSLDLDTLKKYRDLILSFRKYKNQSYYSRMKTIFNVTSNYRRKINE